MEEIKKEEKIVATGGEIDKETFDVMSQEDILTAISSQKEQNRLILNCFMEFLGEIKNLRSQFDEFSQVINICSSDKISAFFKEVQKNVSKEVERQKVQEKVKKSHKKPTKSKKSV